VRRIRPTVFTIVVISLTSLWSTSAAAAAAFGITYAIDTRACVSSTLCDKKQASGTNLANPVTFSLVSSQSSLANGGENAFAQTFGSISYGQIKGYVHGDSSATKLGEADGITDYQAYWADTATVTSTTLGFGTPVTFLMTLDVDAILAGVGPGGMNLTAELIVGNGNQLLANTTTQGAFDYSKGMLVTTFVGAKLSLEGGLLLDAVTQAANCGGCSPTYTVDSSHTANYYLDAITPGVSYTTASGYTYFTPAVPEPSSFLLFGSGALGLAQLLRRKLRL
jgi:hypothetical protein